MRCVRPRAWLFAAVSNVQNLFSVLEPPRGNSRSTEVKLVIDGSWHGNVLEKWKDHLKDHILWLRTRSVTCWFD